MAVTLKDIARLAGVSTSTVSRSLNNSPLIPEETRRNIRRIATEQGFSFNASARGLVLGQTGTIALIFPDYFERFSINLFFSSLQSHIRTVLERANVDVLVAFPRDRATGESNVQKLVMAHKVDGMLVVNNEMDPADAACLKAARMPWVFLHKHPESEVAEADYFCTDHVAGGRLAAQHLLKSKPGRILCVSAIGEEFDARTDGFLQAWDEAGRDRALVDVIYGDCSFEFGSREVARQIQSAAQDAPYSGVFCLTDLMALGTLQALGQLGLRVPDDLLVVGYDDIELGKGFVPSLTTVRQPLQEITELACHRLLELLDGRQVVPEHRLIQPELMIRET